MSEKQARVYHLNNCIGSSASSPPPQSGGGSNANIGSLSGASNQTIHSSGCSQSSGSTALGSAASASAAVNAANSSSSTVGGANKSAASDQHHSMSSMQSSSMSSGASGAIGSSSSHHLERNSSNDWPFAKLFAANNANLFSKCDLSESSFACRSNVVQMRSPDEHCLVSYLATGNIQVLPLPRLQPAATSTQSSGGATPAATTTTKLMDADFVPYSNARIASSMQFSRLGHCLYQPSSTEVCKFTISAQYKALVNDMTGLLYVPREMPEMPRPNFFKSLLSSVSGAGATSSAKQQSERDELFGELGAGKAQRGVAKHIGGSSALDKLKGAAVGTMGHELRMAREGLDERGEKLSEVEDRTQHMMMQSEMYANAAHQLAQKFKDKKWYQF